MSTLKSIIIFVSGMFLFSITSFALPQKQIEIKGVYKSMDKNFVYLINTTKDTVKVRKPATFTGKGFIPGVAEISLKTDLIDFYNLNSKKTKKN